MVTCVTLSKHMTITFVKILTIHFIVRKTIIKILNFVSKQKRHLISSHKHLTISNQIKCLTIWKDVKKKNLVIVFYFFITSNIYNLIYIIKNLDPITKVRSLPLDDDEMTHVIFFP